MAGKKAQAMRRAARQAAGGTSKQAPDDPRPWDGHTPPVVYKPDTRALADRDLHRRIGPVVPPDKEDDWYR